MVGAVERANSDLGIWMLAPALDQMFRKTLRKNSVRFVVRALDNGAKVGNFDGVHVHFEQKKTQLTFPNADRTMKTY